MQGQHTSQPNRDKFTNIYSSYAVCGIKGYLMEKNKDFPNVNYPQKILRSSVKRERGYKKILQISLPMLVLTD